MLFIIALIGTIVLLSMYRIMGRVIVSILVSLAVFIFTGSEAIAYLFYFLCVIPLGKFDEKRRWPRRNRVYNNRSDNSYNNTDSEAMQPIPNTYGRDCPTNVYYIETLNINNGAPEYNRDIAPTYNNKYAKIYEEYRDSMASETNNDDSGWKITGVDWEALERDLRAQGR